MKKTIILSVVVVSVCVVVVGAAVLTNNLFRANLTGYDEVPTISTVATGEFTARISKDETEIEYELSYKDLEGTVQQAHIHIGPRQNTGGISVWLCGNPSAGPPAIVPPAGTPACPASPATVTGVLSASDVVGPNAQGIAATEMAELIAAIRAGKTYANVHTTKFPGGEIRDQLAPGEEHGKH